MILNDTAALAADPAHQVNKWKHTADWWGGRIIPTIRDAAKAAHAAEQVRIWSAKLEAQP
jgi:hypothetical protein